MVIRDSVCDSILHAGDSALESKIKLTRNKNSYKTCIQYIVCVSSKPQTTNAEIIGGGSHIIMVMRKF